jgi:prepilin-type N-terminal cleavage/methylation domain-containing protein/prepilin-type processing-associated H-X9-DG protein
VTEYRPGFTLIEMLVVIGIICLLLGLLLPTLGNTREVARKVQCLANIRQMGHAVQMYHNDYRKICTYPQYAGTDTYYYDLLMPYLTDEDIFSCPSDTVDFSLMANGVSYGHNAEGFPRAPTGEGYPIRLPRLLDIPGMDFGTKMVIADSEGASQMASGVTGESRWQLRRGSFTRYFLSGRHLGAACILFLDGHAGTMSADKLNAGTESPNYSTDTFDDEADKYWKVMGLP